MTNSDQLDAKLQALSSKWTSTKRDWNDSVSAHFETAYIKTLEQQTRKAIAEVQKLSEAISAAQSQIK